MKVIELHIPALLFPVVSLFFIAFTTRFLGLSTVCRQLLQRLEKEKQDAHPCQHIILQLHNLRKRIRLIQLTQILALGTIMSATISMGLIHQGWAMTGTYIFLLALSFLIASVSISVYETFLSIGALDIEYAHADIGEASL